MSPTTEPGSLVNLGGRDGNTEETPITNDPANKGFPAKTQGGELVFIVKQRREHQTKVLITADGTEYVDDGVLGFLVPFSSEDLDPLDPDPVEGHVVIEDPAGVLTEAGETTGGEAIELTEPEDLTENA